MNEVWTKSLSPYFLYFLLTLTQCVCPTLDTGVSLSNDSLSLSEQSVQSQVSFFCEQVKGVNGKPPLPSISGSPGQIFNDNNDKLDIYIKWRQQ